MRRATIGLVVVALALGAAATAHAGSIRNPAERHAAERCDHGRVNACLKRAAIHYRVSYALMRSIAWCESRLQPRAYNPSGASGLMQFMPGTWQATPYRARPVFSAKWNALAGAWLLRRQGTGPWTASRHCWG